MGTTLPVNFTKQETSLMGVFTICSSVVSIIYIYLIYIYYAEDTILGRWHFFTFVYNFISILNILKTFIFWVYLFHLNLFDFVRTGEQSLSCNPRVNIFRVKSSCHNIFTRNFWNIYWKLAIVLEKWHKKTNGVNHARQKLDYILCTKIYLP